MVKLHGIHRAWLVCMGATLLLFTSVGIICNVFTIFQPYIIRRCHLSEGQGSLLITTRVAFTLLSTMVCVRYYNIVEVRSGMPLSLLPGALSMVLCYTGYHPGRPLVYQLPGAGVGNLCSRNRRRRCGWPAAAPDAALPVWNFFCINVHSSFFYHFWYGRLYADFK